jgi:hypothetical protein
VVITITAEPLNQRHRTNIYMSSFTELLKNFLINP